MTAEGSPRLVARVPTHVPGLDVVLKGGLFRAGIYMVTGRPGAGKTILGNQICFEHVARGGRALYVTLLTESHSRLLSSLEPMSFYDPDCLGESLSYVSGYQALEDEKLDGLLVLLRKAVKDHRATLLVIDGLVTSGPKVERELELKKFLHELQILVEFFGCTTLLLTGSRDPDSNYAERTMVDGLLQLSTQRVGMRVVRELEVVKFRGGDILLGASFFSISDDGITVRPRTEALIGRRPPDAGSARKTISLGSARLDELMGGGLLEGSLSLLLGAPGAGKTLFGLGFLAAGAAAKVEEPGLLFGFFEAPSRILDRARRLSPRLATQLERGAIELAWHPPLEQNADELAERLISAVKRRGVRRVFIDGYDGFRDALVYPDRNRAFFTALGNELRALGVTTIVSAETVDPLALRPESPLSEITATVENLFALQAVESGGRMHRRISVVKLREGRHEGQVRELSISEEGLEVAGPPRRSPAAPKRRRSAPRGRS